MVFPADSKPAMVFLFYDSAVAIFLRKDTRGFDTRGDGRAGPSRTLFHRSFGYTLRSFTDPLTDKAFVKANPSF